MIYPKLEYLILMYLKLEYKFYDRHKKKELISFSSSLNAPYFYIASHKPEIFFKKFDFDNAYKACSMNKPKSTI